MNNLLVVTIVLALIVAGVDWWIGIKDPWRKIIYGALVILIIFAVLAMLGVLPLRW